MVLEDWIVINATMQLFHYDINIQSHQNTLTDR